MESERVELIDRDQVAPAALARVEAAVVDLPRTEGASGRGVLIPGGLVLTLTA